MEVGIYKAASAMGSLEAKQAGIASNLANSSVKGHRKVSVAFEGVQSGSVAANDKSFNLVTPQAVSKMSLQPGALSKTDVDTDVAIQGDGFFKFTDINTDNVFFSRNGSLHINASGVLVDVENRPIQGEGGQIQSSLTGERVSINKQGSVFEGTQEIGRLVAYTLPEKLQISGPITANEANVAQISQNITFASGFLEESNVSPIREMVEMIANSKLYETQSRVIKQLDSQLSEALQILGNTNS